MIKFISLIIFVIILNSLTFANNSDTIIHSNKNDIITSDTTYNCMVALSKRNYKKVNLFGLSDSSVKILHNDKSHELIIDSIRSITFYGHGFWTGAAIGGGIGMLLGLIGGGEGFSLTGDGGSNKYSFGQAFSVGFILGIPFGLIGGGLGALFAEDKFYDFSDLNFEAKRNMLIHLMRKYSDR